MNILNRRKLVLIAAVLMACSLSGCSAGSHSGTVIGALLGLGLIAGALFLASNPLTGIPLIGALTVGVVVGGVVGSNFNPKDDKKKEEASFLSREWTKPPYAEFDPNRLSPYDGVDASVPLPFRPVVSKGKPAIKDLPLAGFASAAAPGVAPDRYDQAKRVTEEDVKEAADRAHEAIMGGLF